MRILHQSITWNISIFVGSQFTIPTKYFTSPFFWCFTR